MVVVGIVREVLGNLPQQNINDLHGLYTIGPGASSFTSLVIIFTLLKAFANGGASLTGIEAVSNAVSAFKPPEGLNARRVLVTEGLILGTLVAGISWLAHLTHAAPISGRQERHVEIARTSANRCARESVGRVGYGDLRSGKHGTRRICDSSVDAPGRLLTDETACQQQREETQQDQLLHRCSSCLVTQRVGELKQGMERTHRFGFQRHAPVPLRNVSYFRSLTSRPDTPVAQESKLSLEL